MLGSPTWARTRDLRINSPTTEPGCKPRQCLFITLMLSDILENFVAR